MNQFSKMFKFWQYFNMLVKLINRVTDHQRRVHGVCYIAKMTSSVENIAETACLGG